MRGQMRGQVRCEMRGQELTEAGRRLLAVYARLAHRGEHLLAPLLAGAPPLQWRHYPEHDAVDTEGGFQWFYHSHAPQDRPGAAEHGHIHLFARRPLWARRLHSRAEQAFAAMTGHPADAPLTRHLLAIGFDAKGLPVSLFTVNSWVTGDLMLSAPLTLDLLASLRLATGHPNLDDVVQATLALCREELVQLLARRDAALGANPAARKLHDPSLEVLSEIRLELDAKLQAMQRFSAPAQSRAGRSRR
jgi:hypothetical protein